MVTAARQKERPPIGYAREALRGELPPGFAWVECLSRPHLMQFVAELKDALMGFGISGDDSEVLELLDAWKATASLDAEPEVAEEVLRQRDDTDYVEWSAKR